MQQIFYIFAEFFADIIFHWLKSWWAWIRDNSLLLCIYQGYLSKVEAAQLSDCNNNLL